jgi:hypothetical protein
LMSNKKRVKAHNPSQSTQTQRQTKPYISLVELGIPNDLNIFRQSVIHTSDGIFDTIAETTLDDVRMQILLLNNSESRVKHWTYEKVKSTIDSLKYLNEIKNVEGLLQATDRYNLKEYAGKKLINGKVKWGCENDIRIEFKKYKTKKELCTKAGGAVGAAKDMGVYKKLCDEMGFPERISPTENKEWSKKTLRKIKAFSYPNMKYVKTYKSIRDAERELGYPCIKRVLSGEYKQSKNYYFEYV